MKSSNLRKLYLSNFLTGLVFWYGIEKLFMRSIGIDAVGIGAVAAALTIFLVIFDLPAGLLADKWSRKGVLLVSAISLATASFITGKSHGLSLYILGVLFYGLYVVTTSGTYPAMIYDSLHEEGRSAQYSKINGRILALFLVSAGIGDATSGFIAHAYGFRFTFLLTIVPCLFNAIVIMTMHEPTYHKPLQKERLLHQVGKASIAISKIKLVRTLAIVMILFAIIELFKLEFGQLYMLRYLSSAQDIGILWGVYAFAMALGSLLAHKFRARLQTLIVCAVLPLVLMSFIDNRVSLILFMLQAVATAALLNQIETRIQDNTPSTVRASVLSVVSTIGRAIGVPVSFIIGWIFKNYNGLVAVRFIALVAIAALIYWLVASRGVAHADDRVVLEEALANSSLPFY